MISRRCEFATQDTVKILLHQGCPRAGGGHGIILGDLQSDPLLGYVLIPKDHSVR